MKILILSFHIEGLRGDPLRTLVGINVRAWALFRLLPRYNIHTYIVVNSDALVDKNILAKYGSRIIRGDKEAANLIEERKVDIIIINSTKYQEFLRKRSSFLDILAMTSLPIFGAFCYDNENSPIDSHFIEKLIGVSFTSHDHRLNWDARNTGVPAIVTTAGQPKPQERYKKGDGSAIFIGYVHNDSYIARMARLALADPERKYHIVSSYIRNQGSANLAYHSLVNISPISRETLINSILFKYDLDRPLNLVYSYLPHGEDEELLASCSIGLDFSWRNEASIENSKICRYLTYGLWPIAELPATSSRFVQHFKYGSVIRFNASDKEWLSAILSGDSQPATKNRLRVRRQASSYFSWQNVVAELAYYLQARHRTKKD